MKSIEQKLKIDAQAFSQVPSQKISDQIIDAIHHIDIEKPVQKSTQGLWKIIPAVFAFGLITMVVIHFSSYQLNQLPIDIQTVVNDEPIENKINSIELTFTNPIIKEQQDIISDLNHIESMISLM